MKLRIDGKKIRARRIELGLSRAVVAKRAGTSERTIGDWENGVHMPREQNVAAILEVLGLEVKQEAPPEEKGARAPLVPPSKLRSLVIAERDLAKPEDHATPDGAIPTMTAKQFQNVATAFATFERARFCVRGHVDVHKPLTREEARALGVRMGVGARFHAEVPIGSEHALGVTVHTRDAEITRALLALEGSVATLIVSVVVAEEEAFTIFMAKSAKAWALVVERVGDDDRTARAT